MMVKWLLLSKHWNEYDQDRILTWMLCIQTLFVAIVYVGNPVHIQGMASVVINIQIICKALLQFPSSFWDLFLIAKKCKKCS